MGLATPISRAMVVVSLCLGLCVETNQTRADTPAAVTGFAAYAKQNFQAAQAHYREAPGEATAAWKFVYTGNRWGEERAIEQVAAPRSGERFRVYGKGWKEIKRLRPYAHGPVDYDKLPVLY